MANRSSWWQRETLHGWLHYSWGARVPTELQIVPSSGSPGVCGRGAECTLHKHNDSCYMHQAIQRLMVIEARLEADVPEKVTSMLGP